MLTSGILPLPTGQTRVAECNIGEEVAAFGLVFVNSTNSNRVIVISLYKQEVGSAQSMQVDIGPKGRINWEKPIGLQPGDRLDVSADAAGVSLLWSIDTDTGAIPIATGFTIRGQYSNLASYSACDIVFMNGSSYVAIRDSINKDPETQTADWMLLLDGSGGQVIKDEIVAGAPTSLNTLDKLAAAIGDDPAFAATVASALSLKANTAALSTVAFTGDIDDLVGIKKLAIRRLFFSREIT